MLTLVGSFDTSGFIEMWYNFDLSVDTNTKFIIFKLSQRKNKQEIITDSFPLVIRPCMMSRLIQCFKTRQGGSRKPMQNRDQFTSQQIFMPDIYTRSHFQVLD